MQYGAAALGILAESDADLAALRWVVHTSGPSLDIFFKDRDSLRQALPFERVQILGRCLGRILEAPAMIICRIDYRVRCKTEGLQDEFVGMLRLDSQGCE